jgi:hypothetical protein
MAYVQQDQIIPGANPQGLNAPVAAGGAGAAAKSTKPAASTPGVNVPAQPSAQLSAYLSANQPQASNLAGNIATSIGNDVNATAGAIQPAVNTYTGNLYSVPTDQGVNQAVTSSPSSLTPEQQATYKEQLGASAKAPNSANTFETTQPYQDLTSSIQKSVEQANLWNAGNDVSKISPVLQPFEGPQTTPGDTTLDALLLSQTPEAVSKLQAATAPVANLQTQLDTGAAQANTALQNAIAQDTATTNAVTNAGNAYVQNLTAYLNGAVSKAQDEAAKGNATILTDLQNQTLTPAEQATLGVTNDQWGTLKEQLTLAQTPQTVQSGGLRQYSAQTPTVPIDLTQYLTQQNPNAAITATNTATAKDYADLAALQSMMGTAAPGNVPINTANASQAGTAPKGLSTLDYTSATETAKQTANMEKSAEQAYVDALQNGSDVKHAALVAQNVAINQATAGIATAGVAGAVGGGVLGAGMAGAASAAAADSAISGGIALAGLAGAPETLGISLVVAAVAMAAVTFIPGAAQWIGQQESAIADAFSDFGNDVADFFSGW